MEVYAVTANNQFVPATELRDLLVEVMDDDRLEILDIDIVVS